MHFTQQTIALSLLISSLSTAAHANNVNAHRCDFNGDGREDLAFGSPGEAVGARGAAGAVNVMYGSVNGPSATGDQIFHQDLPDFDGTAAQNDSFGAAITCGDFNHDGYDDLAIGVPLDEVNGRVNAGSVHVVYGGLFGLRLHTTETWTEDTPGIVGSAGTGDRFGSALSSGDYDGDGYDDLAIGIPAQDTDSSGAGAVHILYGAASGLTDQLDIQFNQDNLLIPGEARPDDWFGASLATGDFDNDGYDDLAIGIPRQDVNGPDPENPGQYKLLSTVGAAAVLYGRQDGLSQWGSQVWNTGSPGVIGMVEAFDRFGYALAAGDFDGDGYDDLAIGAPGESVGSADDAGATHVLYGTASGISATGDQIWYQGEIQGAAESRDRFGAALAAADFNGDGIDDLAIGSPGEDVGTKRAAGALNVMLGSGSGLTDAGNQLYYQDFGQMLSTSEEADLFASGLSAGDFNGDGRVDLAIAVPGEAIGSVVGVGAMQVMFGANHGLTSVDNQIWHQGSPGVEGAMEAFDRSGATFLVSSGEYRIPYENGTVTRVSNDTWSHEPFQRIDMSAQGAGDHLVVAAADGEIIAIVDSNWETGENKPNNYVFIQHPNGEVSKYTHMRRGFASRYRLQVGQQVTAGQNLGEEDDVGVASGVHLHFAVSVPHNPANPLSGSQINGIDVVPQFCGVDRGIMVGGASYTASDCN